MSNNFTKVDIDRLTFPSTYKIDYVRVYQPKGSINLGCSPPDYPTAQYLAWCGRSSGETASWTSAAGAAARTCCLTRGGGGIEGLLCLLHCWCLLSLHCRLMSAPSPPPAPTHPTPHPPPRSKRDAYIIDQADDVLIPDVCEQLPYCKSEWGYEYRGGDLLGPDGFAVQKHNVTSPQDCCQLCAAEPACGAWVWNPYFGPVCTFKQATG
ncbi:hypothetical protein ABPG75_002312 [Micractinium tetrahymenae]